MRRLSIRRPAAALAAVAFYLAGLPAVGTAATPAGGSIGWVAQTSGTSAALYSVSCFDVNRCKAVGAGGVLLYTKDAGRSWRPQKNPFSGSATILYRITCIPGSITCYVIARPDIIMVTHNGGVTWAVRRTPLPRETSQLKDAGCVSGQEGDLRARPALCRLGFLDLACTDARTCAAVATLSPQPPEAVMTSAVYATSDGGSTWARENIPGTAPCTGVCAGGRTPYPLEWISCGPGTVCRAGGAIFRSPQSGFASLVIQASKPAGPWTPVKDSWYWSAPDSAVCPTISRCYGVRNTNPFDLPGNGIHVSADGGRQWNEVSSGSPKMRNAIACPGSTTCYSVGNAGAITASTNGGAFVAQASGTMRTLNGIACPAPTACFAVGNQGTIVARR